jgi:EmrB/QacA subfamily drug resistance transporter
VVATVSAIKLALPELAVALGATTRDLTWIADGYTVALAALVLPAGAIGDRLGRRNLLVAGTVVFGIGALVASFAGSPAALIAWRAVMGVGAAMIMPGTLSTITASFPPAERARGVATWSGFASAGAIIGLVASGALLERWGWESIFVTSAIIAAVAGVAALALAPETREPGTRRVDVGGSASLIVALGGLVFAIIEGNENGWTEPVVLAAAAIAAVGTVAYVVADLHHPQPLLDPRLFRERAFRSGTVTVVVLFMAVFGFFFVGLQYLQLMLSYSPLISAIALIPVAVVVVPTALLTPRLVRRLGLGPVMGAGLALGAGAMVWISRLHVDSGYAPFLLGLIVAGVGIGLTSAAGTDAIVASLPRDKQGVASAVNDATREVGSAIGIAVMGSVYGSHYRDALPPPPAEMPAELAEAIRQSAAAGIEIARHLGDLGDLIATPVRAAFMQGLSASLIVIAVVLVAAAVAVWFTAPRRTDPAPHDAIGVDVVTSPLPRVLPRRPHARGHAAHRPVGRPSQRG